MIFINPSHGGYDIGGASNALFKEKDLVLKISKYQKMRFDELGVKNFLIRDDDYFLSINDRLTIINNSISDDDIFISNHLNYGLDQGIEIIYSIKASNSLVNNICEALRKDNFIIRNVYKKLDRTGNDFYDILKYPLCKNKFLIYYGFSDNDFDLDNIIYNWPKLSEAVVKSVVEFLNVPYTSPNKIIYIAKEIESLDDIVSKFKVSKEIIKKENHLQTDVIYPNTELYINVKKNN